MVDKDVDWRVAHRRVGLKGPVAVDPARERVTKLVVVDGHGQHLDLVAVLVLDDDRAGADDDDMDRLAGLDDAFDRLQALAVTDDAFKIRDKIISGKLEIFPGMTDIQIWSLSDWRSAANIK